MDWLLKTCGAVASGARGGQPDAGREDIATQCPPHEDTALNTGRQPDAVGVSAQRQPPPATSHTDVVATGDRSDNGQCQDSKASATANIAQHKKHDSLRAAILRAMVSPDVVRVLVENMLTQQQMPHPTPQ